MRVFSQSRGVALPVAPAVPKHLKATYLAQGEALLRETRGTGLFYFPAPVFWLFIVSLLDFSVLNLRNGSVPAFPGLTALLGRLPTVGSYAPASYLLALFVFLTIVVLLWLFVRYLRWISTVYAVTTSRVIIQKGIFSRDFDEIPVLQVRGVDVHQSVAQRMLGYGTVRVSSEEGSRTTIGNEDWRGIPRPFEFQRLVEAATQSLSRNIAAGPPPPYAGDQTRFVRPPGQL